MKENSELKLSPTKDERAMLVYLPSSPSSPDVNDSLSAISLSRSRTLPRFPISRKASDGPLPPLESAVTNRLRDWILGLVVVEFDVDVGPVVKTTYPSISLSNRESENIAFASFPDSTMSGNVSMTFSFRMRISTHQDHDSSIYSEYSDSGFVYGYTTFNQTKDSASKRGYRQLSLTVLSVYSFPELFSEISSRAAPTLLRQGSKVLSRVCKDIADWPTLNPGKMVELLLLDQILTVEMPRRASQLSSTNSPFVGGVESSVLKATLPTESPHVATTFASLLPHMWAIWECIVLNEPIVAFGYAPDLATGLLWWLREFMNPIPFAGDFRPYFVIQDQDYAAFINRHPPKAGLFLGTTNPLFQKTCRHWPHTIHIVKESQVPGHSFPKKEEVPSGWHSKTYKRHTSKDRPLLKKMETLMTSGTSLKMEGFQHLIHHFHVRSAEFLVPLNRYFNSLILAESAKLRHTKSFDPSNFMSFLKIHGTPLPFRSTKLRNDFYQRWISTPGFGLWLAQREDEVKRTFEHIN